jgi:hypothetical protein
MASKFTVRVQVQGQSPKIVNISAGATVATALKAAKLDPAQFGGSLTVNGDDAELSTRLHGADHILATPKVAGGR